MIKVPNTKIGSITNSQLINYFTKRFMKNGQYTHIEKIILDVSKKLKQSGFTYDFATLLTFLMDSLYLNIEHRPRRVGKQVKQIPAPVRRARLIRKNITFFVSIIKTNSVNSKLKNAIFEEILDSFAIPRAKLWVEYSVQVNLIYANRLNAHWRW